VVWLEAEKRVAGIEMKCLRVHPVQTFHIELNGATIYLYHRTLTIYGREYREPPSVLLKKGE